jgi:hypothetical protein
MNDTEIKLRHLGLAEKLFRQTKGEGNAGMAAYSRVCKYSR